MAQPNYQPSALDEGKLINWLRQFGSDNYIIDAGLQALQHLRLIGRSEAVQSVERVISTNGLTNVSVCPLGDAKDSGNIVAYFAQDTFQSHPGVKLLSLAEALLPGNKEPVIFVDDFIGSGRQSTNIIDALVGKRPRFELGENRKRQLTSAELSALRGKTLYFAFSAGLGGESELRQNLKAHSLSALVHVEIPSNQLPSVFSQSVLPDEKQRTAFQNCCKKIGRALIKTTKKNVSERKVRDRLLGYGNHGLLVTFPYNTPSQTLTCLWSGGEYDGRPWMPLLPRRQKY